MIIGWKNIFERRILERGEDYAYSHAVHDIVRTDDRITAEVDGTETYFVKIMLEEDEVSDMYCTCPYAEGGNCCKHMAAVLYAVEELPDEEIMLQGRTEAVSIAELLEEVSPEEVKAFICRQAEQNTAFANLVRLSLGRNDRAVDEDALIREADLIMADCMNGYYIDRNDEAEMMSEMYRFLNEKLEPLADRGICMSVFRITWHILKELDKIDAESYDGGHAGGFTVNCFSVWDTIIEHCSAEEKEMIKNLLLKRAAAEMDSSLEEFAEDHFWDHDMAVQKLLELDEVIDQVMNENSYLMNTAERRLPQRIKWMKRAGASDEEVEAYMKEHWSFRSIRRMALDAAKAAKDNDQIERILLDSLDIEHDNAHAVTEYTKQLISLYAETGNKEREKQYLQSLLMKTDKIEIEDIRRLKQLCAPDEWTRRINSILKVNSDETQRCMILADESRYEELLETLTTAKDRSLLDQYRIMIPKEYDRQILKLYESQLDMIAYNARRSKEYQEMDRKLKSVISYDGGKQLAKRLADKWVSEYPGRRAMADMLRKYR